MILEDIGPFAWGGFHGIVTAGRPGLYGDVFPSDADGANLIAETLYASGDLLQGGSVSGVTVLRQGQTRYFDHLIESQFRSITDDENDARLDSPLVELFGEVVYFVCGSPPDCKPRL